MSLKLASHCNGQCPHKVPATTITSPHHHLTLPHFTPHPSSLFPPLTPDRPLTQGVYAGVSDDDGSPLYVGCAEHEGGVTPGKLNSSHGGLYISYGGSPPCPTSWKVSANLNVKQSHSWGHVFFLFSSLVSGKVLKAVKQYVEVISAST